MASELEQLNIQLFELQDNEFLEKAIIVYTTSDLDGGGRIAYASTNGMATYEKLGLAKTLQIMLTDEFSEAD